MGIIQPASASALAKQLKDDGTEATKLLSLLAQHYATAKLNIDKLLAHPNSDANDRAEIATTLRAYLATTDELRATVEADIAALEAPPV